MLVARAIRNQPTVLTTTFLNDETPVSADFAVTITVTKADGSVLVATTPAALGATGVYTYTLAPQASLNYLTATWSGSFSSVVRSQNTYCEIRGGEIFTLAEARASDPILSNTTKYPTQLLKDVRCEIEDEFESITFVSFVRKYKRIVRDGTSNNRLITHQRHTKTVLAGTVNNIALTSPELLAIQGNAYGELIRTDGGYWTIGDANIVLEVEYGLDIPPADVRRAALTRLRVRVTTMTSGIPDRATSFTSGEGGTYSLATAGRGGSSTGIPDVDAVLERYTIRIPGIA